MKKSPSHSVMEAQLVTFINKIIRNTATNYYNKEKNRLNREFLAEPEAMTLILTNGQLSRGDKLETLFESEVIGYGLDNLTDKEWKLLWMKYELKMTDNDIAEKLHISRQAVNRRKNLLLNKLRRL
ncbi:sigma-70 family RNA polymerase sigma factor [Enterococcus sp. AZ196]|uniref:sigma-70 family RNA polymerase sigma factor n=1 Tax=Enterococcus sp. AZ196 TaxID=2774659 RepID=UPI003D2DF59E